MGNFYRSILSPILFYGLPTDPEWLHHRTINVLSWLAHSRSGSWGAWLSGQLAQSYRYQAPCLNVNLWGLNFLNPIGLAAGFDKNAEAVGIWSSLGFGFTEVGTITWHPQPGNPQPRLFRLLSDRAVLNRMGFNNLGAEAVFSHLQSLTELGESHPLGINLGKSKITPLELAATDYLDSFKILKDVGDYFVVNVSSPNTPGLRSLQDATMLSTILDALQQFNQGEKPLLVKIAPDLAEEAIASIIDLAKTYQLAGLIATNTTISRDHLKTEYVAKTGKLVKEEAGGISGAPLRQRSTEIIKFIWQQTQGKLPIIGVGGIFNADDAWEKITAGASLIQVYTGLVYQGPAMVKEILQGLEEKLNEKGLNNIQEAIGISNSII